MVLGCERVNEDFIGFGSESNHSARRAHLNRQHLVRILDLGHWSALVTVPEEDRRSLPAGHQLELVVAPLRHTEERPVLGLVAVDPLFLLEVVGGDGAVGAARMNQVRLLNIWEKRDDVLLLVCRQTVMRSN